MTAFDIVSIGEPLFEFNQPKGETAYRPGFGGDTSNMAIAAARQGARVACVSALGADQFGDALRELWKREGVDDSAVKTHPTASTGLYFVSHGPEGHVFSYLRAGSAASLVTPADIPEEMIREARVVHASGISVAISSSAADSVFHAFNVARKADTIVSFDTNLRLRLWPIERARAVTHAAAAMADILKSSIDDAGHLTGLTDPDAVADYYLGLGASIVLLTLGGDGALVATREKRERLSPKPVKLVDATGAGDTFAGAFLTRYLATKDPFAAAQYANVAAALSTQGYSAVEPMPTREAVEAAIAAGW